jgi:hypothetical protein
MRRSRGNQGEAVFGRAFFRGHQIQAEPGFIQAGASMPASAHLGSGRFGKADFLAARLAVDSGGAFGDPGSANAVLPEARGAAHLKPIAGIGIVSRMLPVAGGHGRAFFSAVMGNRASQRTVMEIGARQHRSHA